jgi:hypothetical protein
MTSLIHRPKPFHRDNAKPSLGFRRRQARVANIFIIRVTTRSDGRVLRGRERAMNTPRRTKELKTVTVTGSQSVASPNGHVAIVLYTKEVGPIAFEVDQKAIDALRREIAVAEKFLREPTGRA